MLPVRDQRRWARACPTRPRRPDVDSRHWSDAVSRTLLAERVVPGLRIPGADGYLSDLAKGRAAALGGEPPEKALEAVAKAWAERTKALGPKRQLWHYRRSLNSLVTLPQPPGTRELIRATTSPARSRGSTVRGRDRRVAEPSLQCGDVETEVKELMGLFDAPRLRAPRAGPRVRAAAVARPLPRGPRRACSTWCGSGSASGRAPSTGPDDWSGVFTALDRAALAALRRPSRRSGPTSPRPDPPATAIARDLVAAVLRFNRRWIQFLDRLNLEPANHVIDQYNRYYVLEKECVMGSARLAARHLHARAQLTDPHGSCDDHPTLARPRTARSTEPADRAEPSHRTVTTRDRVATTQRISDRPPAPSVVSAATARPGVASPRSRSATAAARAAATTRRRLRGARAWPSRSPVRADAAARADQGARLRDARPGQGGGRAAVGPELVPARSRSSPSTSRAGSRASRCGSIPRRTASPARSTSSKPGRYAIQAVVRLNPDTHRIGDGEGNAYGPVVHAELDPEAGRHGRARRSTSSSRPGRSQSTDRIKLVELASPMLSAFHHRPIKHRAAVILPEDARRADRPTSCRRSTSSPGSAATTSWPRRSPSNPRTGLRQGLHPRGARPRLRHGPPRLRRQRDQRPARHGAGRGVHPATSRRRSPRSPIRAPGC